MSTVSHELRTPLNCIITLLDTAKSILPYSEELNSFLLPALHSSKLLLNLINDLLDMS